MYKYLILITLISFNILANDNIICANYDDQGQDQYEILRILGQNKKIEISGFLLTPIEYKRCMNEADDYDLKVRNLSESFYNHDQTINDDVIEALFTLNECLEKT